MLEVFSKLQEYLGYSFVQYAILTGVLISVCSSLLGVPIVLKRFSLIGDGISHVSFCAVVIATICGLTNTLVLSIPLTVLFSVLLLGGNSSSKLRGDSAIAMLSVGALALGYFLINIFSKSANLAGDVCGTLFGSTSILTQTVTDVWICIVMSIVIIGAFLLFYHKFFAVTFDDRFAQATGVHAKLYNMLISVFIASVITLSMKLVGTLLISALIVFPVLSAQQLCATFRGVSVLSVSLSTVCTLLGLLYSIVMGTPVGATIVVVDIVAFVECYHVSRVDRHPKI